MRLPRAPRLLAVATLVAAASGLALVAAAPVSAAGTVAIVISFSGGVDEARCVPAGSTGDSILNQVASVAYRRDGIITQINNQPATGVATTLTHYWAYFHDTGSGWSYSSVGASSYTPAAGTVEGWRYDNGEANAPYPPAVSYAAICGAPASAAPPPTVATTAAGKTVSTAAPSGRQSPSSPPSGVTAPADASPPVDVAGATAVGSGASATASVAVSGRASSSAAPPTVDASPVSRASTTGRTGGSPAAAIIGSALAVVLAGAAVVVARRRRAG